MTEEKTMSLARLRKQASHCRRIAEQALSDQVATEFEVLAGDYDKDAVHLEETE